ncbi:MAG: IS200/IS605 family transposase [Treponema sp.]|jgi:REP element-mobilizing transposase RayT|nr:IS200/IS605 family transposase [Treponema sp.]
MSEYIRKSHNASVLSCHIVCPAKYRRIAIGEELDKTLEEAREEIGGRHGMRFLEMGAEGDRARFPAQSVPAYSPTKMAAAIKSAIARETLARHPEAKGALWGGELWADGHFTSSAASGHGSERVITSHVESQGTAGHCKRPRGITIRSHLCLTDFQTKSFNTLRQGGIFYCRLHRRPEIAFRPFGLSFWPIPVEIGRSASIITIAALKGAGGIRYPALRRAIFMWRVQALADQMAHVMEPPAFIPPQLPYIPRIEARYRRTI